MTWLPDKYTPSKSSFLSSTIRAVDKQVVVWMVDRLLATKIGKSRASKYYIYARLVIERGWLHTYQGVTEKELYSCLTAIEHNLGLGPEAKRDYKITLKRILEELHNPLYEIIKTGQPAQHLPRFFLTPFDILKMVRSPWPHLRDKAIAACLFESDCRPHEFFGLRREDIRIEQIPAKINNHQIGIEVAYLNISQDCKTGARSPPLIWTVPWLKAWLDTVRYNFGAQQNTEKTSIGKDSILLQRPDFVGPQSSYIWIELRGARTGEHLEYAAALKAVKHLAQAAGIKNADKVTLYSFRHGRNTEISQSLTYAQQCEYAGWQQGSDMPRVYNHLSGVSMVAPLLSPFGIEVDKGMTERQAWIEIMREGQKALRTTPI